MEIDINQKAISIGDKYNIFVNGVEEYTASVELFSFLPEISLFKKDEKEPTVIIKKELTAFKALFTITIMAGNVLKFTTTSFWKWQFQCISDNDTYTVFANKGRTFSIYKNDTQVAYWELQMVSWFKGDNYKLYADNNCDKELLIAFCLIMDNYENNDSSKTTVNFDFGGIGWGLKKFDPEWKPK